ncbi:hypothetical protein F2981_08585 [Sinorhizobium meliloti]|nr:hypothetical protein [Sinorhizobium meliloti]
MVIGHFGLCKRERSIRSKTACIIAPVKLACNCFHIQPVSTSRRGEDHDQLLSNMRTSHRTRFQFPPEQVFEDFADPAAHDRWFVKADNWPSPNIARLPHRRPGKRPVQPGRKVFYFNETIYLDIVENGGSSRPIPWRGRAALSASIATVDLIPEGTGTRVVFTEQGAFLDGLERVEYRREGWEQ